MSNNDFDKTMPNIPSSQFDDDKDDWGKTSNQKYSPQPNADDWGKTMPGYNIPRDDEPDFNKTYQPSNQNNPKVPDWGLTQDNIKIPRDVDDNDFGGERRKQDVFMTTPLIRLPDDVREKYQNIPPTATEEQAKQEQQEKEKGGIPAWLWASAGILIASFIIVFGLIAAWFLFFKNSGFEVTLTNVPSGSRVKVNKKDWNVTTETGGKRVLALLEAGDKKIIEIENPNWTCKPIETDKGVDGVPQTFSANCDEKKAAVVKDECKDRKFKQGEEALAQSCAEKALANLQDPIDPDELARILSIYIINFDRGKFDIPQKNKDFLQKASVVMKKLKPGTVIEIGGHTDSDGTDENNMTLSNNRAKAVREVLVKEFTVPSETLTEKGYGETKPKPGNENRNPDEKFQNRRIEYTVIKKG
ncbi:MAG TPA: OmpA family protein [Pyrinomonadaceae bacterium]|nr:OmpA family protein [Pyrinomonadaceae bacterium]